MAKFYCVLCHKYRWGKPVGRTSDGDYCKRHEGQDRAFGQFYCVLCRRYRWGRPVGRTSNGEICRRHDRD
ncbi:MAG: hypothetical protein ACODAE_11460 [Gemmatimonadota bacterium]